MLYYATHPYNNFILKICYKFMYIFKHNLIPSIRDDAPNRGKFASGPFVSKAVCRV